LGFFKTQGRDRLPLFGGLSGLTRKARVLKEGLKELTFQTSYISKLRRKLEGYSLKEDWN